MSDYQKYINALKKCAKEHENDRTFTGHIIVADLCRDTANLLEELEQEPKTVLYSGDGYADGYMVYDMAECPNCGYEYEDGDKDWGLSFCPNCGQSLNWESEE